MSFSESICFSALVLTEVLLNQIRGGWELTLWQIAGRNLSTGKALLEFTPTLAPEPRIMASEKRYSA
jgi:hypothetical protein